MDKMTYAKIKSKISAVLFLAHLFRRNNFTPEAKNKNLNNLQFPSQTEYYDNFFHLPSTPLPFSSYFGLDDLAAKAQHSHNS